MLALLADLSQSMAAHDRDSRICCFAATVYTYAERMSVQGRYDRFCSCQAYNELLQEKAERLALLCTC